MNYTIRSAAREDILRQYFYYAVEQNEELVAERFQEAVRQSIFQVCEHPGIGARRRTVRPELSGLRSWPIKGFSEIRLYYLVSASQVRIVRVLHGKRDLRPLLEGF